VQVEQAHAQTCGGADRHVGGSVRTT
jgi:hypothetical protein